MDGLSPASIKPYKAMVYTDILHGSFTHFQFIFSYVYKYLLSWKENSRNIQISIKKKKSQVEIANDEYELILQTMTFKSDLLFDRKFVP